MIFFTVPFFIVIIYTIKHEILSSRPVPSLTANGTAVGLSKRCPTQHPGSPDSYRDVTSWTLTERSERHGVQDLFCWQMRALPRPSLASVGVSGYMNHYKIVLSAGAIKNRDKLIDPCPRYG
jgi:hypothetical protein